MAWYKHKRREMRAPHNNLIGEPALEPGQDDGTGCVQYRQVLSATIKNSSLRLGLNNSVFRIYTRVALYGALADNLIHNKIKWVT